MEPEAIKELINRRRRQLLVHSTMYYRLNDSIIGDLQFDKWAYELVDLQEKYPEIAKECVFADGFKKFDGSTGFDLPTGDSWARATARYLIKLNRMRGK